MLCCISSCSVGTGGVTFGFQPCRGVSEDDSLPLESAVLMIFTSPLAVLSVSVAGAIDGFVMTGLAAAGVEVRRDFFFFRVCAVPSTTQKVRTRHKLIRTLL